LLISLRNCAMFFSASVRSIDVEHDTTVRKLGNRAAGIQRVCTPFVRNHGGVEW
jgi:hypothetical protein